MTLAIYGDSFGASTGPTSWTSIIKLNFNTEVFAEGATSLYWSYKKFLNTYKNFDKIIFLVTDHGRLYHRDLEVAKLICNLFCLENRNPSKQDKVYEAAKLYYMYLQDPEQEKDMHRLMLEHIINLCKQSNKQLVLVPSMNSIPADILANFSSDFCLTYLNDFERDLFKIPHDGMLAENKNRLQNHITDENNLILSQLLTRVLNGEEIKISLDNFNLMPNWVDEYYHNELLEKIKNETINSR